MDRDARSAADSDGEVVRTGMRFGYGHWLQPIVNSNDMRQSSPEMLTEVPRSSESVPQRRGRGRPRVSRARDESAIEKRRAQVREAQRTYQKRKDSAAASEKRRCDDLLQVLSDLSTDVEALLQVASKAGVLDQHDEVSARVRQLWSTYDATINHPSLLPELRLHRIKNDRRKAEHQNNEDFQLGMGPTDGPESRQQITPLINTPSDIDLQLVRVDSTTVLQPFVGTTSSKIMGGRNIFDVVKERQAIFHNRDGPS
ncbi:hypothetical protein BS50DRAFT_630486 [Corynespora cassiicola Philippines]|uniref:BZIP domain-containing protein n=1 Tax=Corynespora cassiicola Philippines TaxID=1448308 RepID=A0A2T2P442_CORCC|nr:hypothetical protein BS50DRAFT_630486 [Corynespora cassiicola Philippines]